jgi:hypothetical protein
MDEVVLAEIEYSLDSPCMVPLVGLPLIARGHYTEVSPLTVALRLMEDRRDGMKEIGVIRTANQRIERDFLDMSAGVSRVKLPGQVRSATMTITAELFPEVVEEDWQGIRPDVPLSDFKGIMVSMQKSIH